MNCAACGFSNPDGMKFCGECGKPLASGCPQCGFENPPGFKFCGECGAALQGSGHRVQGSDRPSVNLTTNNLTTSSLPRHLADKIRQSKSTLEGERKQVTVLFADVKGSMEMAEQMDPEEWSHIMQRFFGTLSEGVERFEGYVDKFTGDGIMALFGAPITHEDHAQRACYAALQLQEELRKQADQLRLEAGMSFSVRIGLNSGEVVVGKIRDDLGMDYTAQGYVVGLASRMEQICEPGRVYMTEHTARSVDGYFELRDLGETNVKGVSRPIRVHELLGVGELRTRFDLSRARGLSKFVGRTDEMGVLEKALADAREGGGQVVGIVGYAGVGKSRLCFEFTRACRARGVRVYEAHGVSHEKSVPLLPVLELFRNYFGINDGDDDRIAREKIAGRMLLLDPGFSDVLPLMFDFLGVPDAEKPAPDMGGDARQEALFGVMRRLADVRSRQAESVVFLLEDLHWTDPASRAFVAQLVDSLPTTRTLVLANFRPEFHAEWMSAPHYRHISLEPLGLDAAEELLGAVLGTDDSLEGLAHRVVERTGGNPFYMEEVVQALVEEGALQGTKGAYRLVNPAADVSIPPTVQTILAARIDRLPEASKRLLQAAAVIGKIFSRPLLESVVNEVDEPMESGEIDAALASLADAEFVFEQSLYPVREYAFKHALTQEVSYNAQLVERRRRLHAAAARALAETVGQKVDENAALIGRQWEAADNWLEAARWYVRAAEWMMRSDVVGAMQHFRKTRDLVARVADSDEASRIELHTCQRILDLGFRFGMEPEEQLRLFERGVSLAEKLGDRDAVTVLESVRQRASWSSGHAVVHTTEAAPTAGSDPEAILQSGLNAMVTRMMVGDSLTDAVAASDDAVELIERRPDLARALSGISVVGFRALVLSYNGRLDEADALSARVLLTAREIGALEAEGFANGWRSLALLGRGQLPEALRHARAAVEIAEKVDSPFSRVIARMNCCNVGSFLGLWPETERWGQEGVDIIFEQNVARGFEPFMLTFLGEALAVRGETDRARELVDEAIANAASVMLFRAYLGRARIQRWASKAPDAAQVEATLRAAEDHGRKIEARSWIPWVYEERAALAEAFGEHDERRVHLEQAKRLYEELGARGHLERIEKLLSQPTVSN